MNLDFNIYSTLLIMILALLAGRFLTIRFKVLKKYDIPEPVSGGVLLSILFFLLSIVLDLNISFNDILKDPLMLVFFTSLGLTADLKILNMAGKSLIIFIFITIGLLIMQNIIGVGLILLMGENPLIGLISASISLTGGFGTGAAWGTVFENAPYHFETATAVSVASATFGVVMAGLLGGPLSNFLIKKYNLKNNIEKKAAITQDKSVEPPTTSLSLISVNSIIDALGLITISMFLGIKISNWMSDFSFTLPTFVWCLFFGVFFRNTLSHFKFYHFSDREMDIIGNVSLSLFLALVLMNINPFVLVHLAIPVIIVLVCQLIFMFFYGWLITFNLCGKNYDAAVLAGGQCGFAIGSTYNAIANIQSITEHHGPSRQAFIIIPIVGAFFIDIINATVINIFLLIPIFTS